MVARDRIRTMMSFLIFNRKQSGTRWANSASGMGFEVEIPSRENCQNGTDGGEATLGLNLFAFGASDDRWLAACTATG